MTLKPPRRLAPPYDHYSEVQTDERVMVVGTRYGKHRAHDYAARYNKPIFMREGVEMQMYHCRVEKVGFLKYNIVAYQNRLVPNEELEDA